MYWGHFLLQVTQRTKGYAPIVPLLCSPKCIPVSPCRNIAKAMPTLQQIGALIRGSRKCMNVTQKNVVLTSGTGFPFIIDLEKDKEAGQIGKVLTVIQALGVKVTLTPPVGSRGGWIALMHDLGNTVRQPGLSLQPIAHAPKQSSTPPHVLEEHLSSVEQLAAQMAAGFDGKDWGTLAGRWHDLGKFSPEFQKYIRGVSGYEAHLIDMLPAG